MTCCQFIVWERTNPCRDLISFSLYFWTYNRQLVKRKFYCIEFSYTFIWGRNKKKTTNLIHQKVKCVVDMVLTFYLFIGCVPKILAKLFHTEEELQVMWLNACVRTRLTKIQSNWTIFLYLSFDILNCCLYFYYYHCHYCYYYRDNNNFVNCAFAINKLIGFDCLRCTNVFYMISF